MVHGYTAVPVLNDQEQYIGSVTEGDFLRHLLVVWPKGLICEM